jgi:hypothetical protein
MTPEGEFRDAPQPPRGSWLDRAVARVGGVALLIAGIAGGLALVALAIAFVTLLVPVALVAGSVAAVALWWRMRRLRRAGVAPSPFIIIRH